MTIRDRLHVVLLWPGGLFSSGANFGIPQILSIAASIEQRGDVDVTVIDLDMERAWGKIDLLSRIPAHCDILGVSCYSSFDFLKIMAICEQLKAHRPNTWFVVGGYHASARPDDFLFDGSPFDFVVIGDGEYPMQRLVEARAKGRKPLLQRLGPESVHDIQSIAKVNWHHLDRYRPVARKLASQAEIYLSRGCPYDCAFCMERAKRDVSWRSIDALEAVEEMHRLDAFLDLSSWTLFIADALFGMKRGWRKTFLEALAKRPLRARKVWLLIRVDLIERDDLELMAKANIAPGFGLESGDETQLRLIRKAGRLDDYLEKMIEVASWAHEYNVPFGANVIAGHPGETETSMRSSARYLERLFLGDSRGTMGFLSVDPFRLYPGSPIDEHRADWEAKTGMHPHRYPWWNDGDQDFLAQWIDPSRELSYERSLELRHELFTPILRGIEQRFAYQGPTREYFMGSVREQTQLFTASHLYRNQAMAALWRSLIDDVPLVNEKRFSLLKAGIAAREERLQTWTFTVDPPIIDALIHVPRERFVRDEDVADAQRDRPLVLEESPLATVSAMHAYAMNYQAISLQKSDQLVELGSGSGYGAALASQIVGPSGSVQTIEFDEKLAALTAQNLESYTNVHCVHGDAHDVSLWNGASKVVVTFALNELPSAWIDALASNAVLVAPIIQDDQSQRLLRLTKSNGALQHEWLESVRYVTDRHTTS